MQVLQQPQAQRGGPADCCHGGSALLRRLQVCRQRACRGTCQLLQTARRSQAQSPNRSQRFCLRAAVAEPLQQKAPPAATPVKVDGVDNLQLSESTTLLRCVCNQRLKFEVDYGLKRGTTNNCYLLKVEDKTVLIDVPDQAFTDEFVAALQNATPLDKITHIITTHLTPERMKSLRTVLEKRGTGSKSAPLELLLSNPALQLLRSTLSGDEEGSALLSSVEMTTARLGTCLELGPGHSLRLLPISTPRWPDLLAVYSDADRTLFTSKLFACHVSPAAAGAQPGSAYDDGGWDVYAEDWRHYYDCMLAPVARQAAGVLERLEGVIVPAVGDKGLMQQLLEQLKQAVKAVVAWDTSGSSPGDEGASGPVPSMLVASLAPMHGPIVRSSLQELLTSYSQWNAAQLKAAEAATVAVLYASAYGNTAALAQAISRGITKAGVGVETLNLEVSDMEDVQEVIGRSVGFVIGSPTLGGHMPTQVQTALGSILRQSEAKVMPCGVFGSFGWSGEAVDEMQKRLTDAGFKLAFDPIRVKFKPTGGDLQVCEESGTDLAQLVRKKQQAAQKQAAKSSQVAAGPATGLEQAMGRVVGSLCVVTSRDGDAESGMLASWVSQASFDPPGLSVAVKKDRAVDSLLVSNNKFVLNILKEGSDKVVMKHMLKPFGPAEDRFAGLDTDTSEATGAKILLDGAAYLECTVQNRLLAGDHYVVYATVEGGQVIDDGALSAVHQRKVGTNY